MVTDPDVVPTVTCPHDLVRRMLEALAASPTVGKVGPSLRVDNLPPHYLLREEVVEWETAVLAEAYRGWRRLRGATRHHLCALSPRERAVARGRSLQAGAALFGGACAMV